MRALRARIRGNNYDAIQTQACWSGPGGSRRRLGRHRGNAPQRCAGGDGHRPGGVQIFITPYLVLFGVYSTIETPLAQAPTINSSVGPFQLLGDLDGIPFLGSAEVRFGPIGLLGDVLHVPVETTITTRNVFFQGGSAALITNTGTAVALYRFLDAPNQYADFGGGFRAWGFESRLELNPGLLPGVVVKQRAGWATRCSLGAITTISAAALAAPPMATSAGSASARIPIGRSWARSTMPSARGSTSTSAIAASTSTTRPKSAAWASTSNMRGPIFAGTFRF
jgi:hypothetical protein